MTYVKTTTERFEGGRRERTNTFVYWEAHCPSCEWFAPDRRQIESDAWGDLQAHLRTQHGGNVRQVKVRKTIIEEVVEENE